MTDAEIISTLRIYYDTTNKPPSIRLSAATLGVAPSTVRTRFGTWNNALVLAGIPITVRPHKQQIKCTNCGHSALVVPSRVNMGNNFCSLSCSASYNNARRNISDETRQKQAVSLALHRRKRQVYQNTCATCSNVFDSFNKRKKTCSNACYREHKRKTMSDWLSHNRSHVRGPHKQSYMEHSFQRWLELQGVHKGLSGYLTEVHFYNTESKKNGWADFVFPRKKLIIELDGSHHAKRVELDRERDCHLHSRGWTVLRITHKEYNAQTKLHEVRTLLNIKEPPTGIEPV